jgi:hypothetical protein
MGSHLHSFPFPYKKKKTKKTPRFIPMNKKQRPQKFNQERSQYVFQTQQTHIFLLFFFVIPEIEQSPPSLKGVVVYKRGEVDIASPLPARGVCVL